MGAWGEGMQANDTALDAIGDLEDKVSGLSWDERGDEAITSEQVQTWVNEAGIDAALEIGKRMDCGYGNQGLLGIAEFLHDHGVEIPIEKVDPIIQEELSTESLECWRDSSLRREALELFRRRLTGETTEEDEALSEHHNRGLFQRIAEGGL